MVSYPAALATLFASTLLVLAASALRAQRAAVILATGGCVVASALLLAAGIPAALGGPAWFWTAPDVLLGASASFGIDALSGLFLVAVGILAIPAVVFAAGYLPAHAGGWGLAAPLCMFNLLVAAITVVLTARNGLLFLVGWEAMTLASFFLVGFDHARAEVRLAGQRYLIASFLGSGCLLALFAILGDGSRGLAFVGLAEQAAQAGPGKLGLVLTLAVIGFGTKAGLVPLHVWLPLAHPAAPSHVSSLMSGVMIKCGIYGLLRVQTLLPAASWGLGFALLIAGVATALTGIVTAIGQRDIKRALAYSSIENIGIITIGTGLAMMAAALGRPDIAIVAATGALLHTFCHMLMKGLLFLTAGSVLHATHVRDLERMGGLLRSMPSTGTAFLVGAAAISALPPLCGFVGEWLILVAGFQAAASFAPPSAIAVMSACLALILAGGFAAASFTRLFAVAFLGQPRSEQASAAHEVGPLLALPPLLLAGCCLLVGVVPELAVAIVQPAAAAVTGSTAAEPASAALAMAADISRGALILLLLAASAVLARTALGRAARAPRVDTWGCGYALPDSSLQYTATSFAQPLLAIFGVLLGVRTDPRPAAGPFPTAVANVTTVPDRIDSAWVALFSRIARRLAVARRFQSGKLTSYLLLVVTALIAGLIFAVASGRVAPR